MVPQAFVDAVEELKKQYCTDSGIAGTIAAVDKAARAKSQDVASGFRESLEKAVANTANPDMIKRLYTLCKSS